MCEPKDLVVLNILSHQSGIKDEVRIYLKKKKKCLELALCSSHHGIVERDFFLRARDCAWAMGDRCASEKTGAGDYFKLIVKDPEAIKSSSFFFFSFLEMYHPLV